MNAFFYFVGITSLKVLYGVATLFNPKARAFRQGRAEQVSRLRSTFPLPGNPTLVWFHCASLGEFEQGRPVMEALKQWRPDLKLLLTFFSPSGYEVRKNYPHADYIFYLPWDTSENARWFADQVRPTLVVFVKYEFWLHYSQALHRKNIPLISISAIFRSSQVYFKWHGSLFRNILKNFSWFFVQDEPSVSLLHSIGISNVKVAGDTRFDRVYHIAQHQENFPLASQFVQENPVMVIGSAWPADLDVLTPFINSHPAMKFIVAPHEINEPLLETLEKSLKGKTFRYSRSSIDQVANAQVLLIDHVGILAQLYRYGSYAFVGGGFREGLHNILEPASYGIPVFFGGGVPFDKFLEAVDLVSSGGAFVVNDTAQLEKKFNLLNDSNDNYQAACNITSEYVKSRVGATKIITAYCQKILS